ncbi:MAG: glutathione binding-like protein [Phenylobacterium sp.]
MTITIYHAEARRSERVAWLLEEMGRDDYELVFKPGDVRGSAAMFRESGHGFPMAPIVRIGDELLVESAAILETLMNRNGDHGLRPAITAPEHAAYLEWLHFAESSAMPRIQQAIANRRLPPAETPEAQAMRDGLIPRVLTYVDNRLGAHDYLAGSRFSAADIQMHFPLRIGVSFAPGRQIGGAKHILNPDPECYTLWPNIGAWVKRLEARPAFQRAMAKTMPLGFPDI